MKGDFTRQTFDPRKHYVAVRAQQGRVTVDADVNELQDIADHRRTAAADDVIGPVGAPADDPFGVEVLGGTPTVTSGHLWLDGVLVEADQDHPLDDQPHVPGDVGIVRQSDGTWVDLDDAPDGRYLAYVDAWRRHVTALDDPSIREVALGGPDTATREQLVWQVRLLRVGDVGDAIGCADPHAAWDEATAEPDGVLAARAEPDEDAGGPCLVPAAAGFRRLDNQLYRVEVHAGGATGVATWKASRDNGAVERGLVGISGNELEVTRPGRDAADGFPSGSWVEVTDDTRELAGQPGTMVRVVRADGDAIEVDPGTATGPLTLADFPDTPRVRRWDTDGPRTIEVGPGPDGFLELEDGVQVRFAAGATWRTGDYWMIPARVATGDVEWPRTGGVPDELGPHGVRHHHARLAVLTHDGGTWTLEETCSPTFPPLTALRTIDHVGGDGQEAMPDLTDPAALVPLPQPIVVGVSMGSLPVPDATVRFEVAVGNGALDGTAPGTPVDVVTDGAGLASVSWAVDPVTTSQQVVARLLAPDGTPEHLPVVFGAELSTAATTSYDPEACPPLAGAVTVQDAIDRLCELGHNGCATLTLSPGEGWQDALEQLPAGEDAVICFRPGEYVTDRTVVLQDLGDVQVHGGGAATVVRGTSIERVLVIEDATSAHVADLEIRAGAVGTSHQGHEHIGGALTVIETREVTIERVRARSVAGVRRQASCITVRAGTGTTRVRVRDCDLTVGHRQMGLLLVDCDDAQVSGNRVRVAPKPRRLGFDDLVADPAIRGRLVDRLVSDIGAGVPVAVEGANTVLEAGGWRLAFNSSVPTGEWEAIMREEPPTADEVADADGMAGYAERLIGGMVEQPSRSRTFDLALEGIRNALRGNQPLDEAVARRVAVTGDVSVVESDPDRVSTTVADDRVSFRSELDSATWEELLEEADVGDASGEEAVRAVAERIVLEEDFRRRAPAAAAWFAALRDNNPAVASQGIVIGGRVARKVDVTGNLVDDAVVGIQVGLSHRASAGAAPDVAGRVRITDNVVSLQLPMERKRGQFGIFVGNVDHATIAGNSVRMTTRAATARPYDEGLRIWGHLGLFLAVRENVVTNAVTGIRIVPLDDRQGGRQWFAVDNVAAHATTSVDAPASVRQEHNVP